MLVHRRDTLNIKFPGTHLYTWVERGTMMLKCLAHKHKVMSLGRAQTQTTWSGVECSNHDATAPPSCYILSLLMIISSGIGPTLFSLLCPKKHPFSCHGSFFLVWNSSSPHSIPPAWELLHHLNTTSDLSYGVSMNISWNCTIEGQVHAYYIKNYKLQRLSVTRALQRFFSHFKNYVLVDVNQMYPWQ